MSLNDGWTFTDPDGTLRRRQRNPHGIPIWDLDCMDRKQLNEFLKLYLGKRPHEQARAIFPDRPLYMAKAAGILRLMANAKLRGWKARYEELYQQLPEFARFRKSFNIAAAVQKGKAFRKYPPRDRSSAGQNQREARA